MVQQMKKDVIILLAEDDEGHATLIMKNLRRSGISNEIIHFKDGQETLDFLMNKMNGREHGLPYLMLLDIRMPKVDGVEVLRKIRNDRELKKMPVIMITTTNDQQEVENCHRLGCSNYINKPVDYDKFVDAIKKLGLFLMVVEIPKINGELK